MDGYAADANSTEPKRGKLAAGSGIDPSFGIEVYPVK